MRLGDADADVGADGSHGRDVADAESGSYVEVVGVIAVVIGRGARVGEDGHSHLVHDRHLQLDGAHGEVLGARQLAVGVLGGNLLVAEAAHRLVAAREEAEARGDIVDGGSQDGALLGADHEP